MAKQLRSAWLEWTENPCLNVCLPIDQCRLSTLIMGASCGTKLQFCKASLELDLDVSRLCCAAGLLAGLKQLQRRLRTNRVAIQEATPVSQETTLPEESSPEG